MTGTTGGPIRGTALRDAKRALRAHVLALRDALDAAARALDSTAIGERIAGRTDVRRARVLLVTLPFRTEWDTRALVQRSLASGVDVVVPRVDPGARMLVLHSVRDLAADIVAGHAGVPEPRPGCRVVDPSSIDAVVVPGVAFDPSGGRLGYGGGYYDRLLPLLRPGVPRIAGAFDVQVVEHVPRGPLDLVVDCVVTPTRQFGAP